MQNSILDATICVVGLGYVGLPLLAHMRKKSMRNAVGYDIQPSRRDELRHGFDHTGMLGDDLPYHDNTKYGAKPYVDTLPKDMDIYVVCVPTPELYGVPDYRYIRSAVGDIAEVMRDDSIIILESTVGPGTTERLVREIICIIRGTETEPLLAYSPERINPSPDAFEDMVHTTKLIGTRLTGAPQHLVQDMYRSIFDNVHLVDDPMVAELAKCFENTQRDMNIALMNELSEQCSKNGVNYSSVEDALRTKDSNPKFTSGIVGGHCIPVDPYYLAQWYGSDTSLPAISRTTNMKYVQFVADLVDGYVYEEPSDILIIGGTYKPDVADTRNSGAKRLKMELESRGHTVAVYDELLGDPLPDTTHVRVVVGLVNHTSTFNTNLRATLLPRAIDCIAFIAVDRFTPIQLKDFTLVSKI